MSDNLSQADLRKVKAWQWKDVDGLMELIRPVFDQWGRLEKKRRKDSVSDEWVDSWELATGGWSGCEEVISALRQSMFWMAYWQRSERGGLHVFHVPIKAKP